MNTRLFHNSIRIAALFVPLLIIALSAQLGFAGPATNNGASPAAPTPYALFGDKTNTVGSGEAIFHTTSGNATGAFQFKADGPNVAVLNAYCSPTSDCAAVRVQGADYGVQADSGTGGANNNDISYGVAGATGGSGPYAIGVYGLGNSAALVGGQVGVKGQTLGKQSVGVWGVSPGTAVYAENMPYGSPTINPFGGASAVYAHSGIEQGFAVYGVSDNDKAGGGIYASTKRGNGVYGAAEGQPTDFQYTAGVNGYISVAGGVSPARHAGVYGLCYACNGVTGQTESYIGVRGYATGAASTAYGGYFSATAGIGLYAESSSNYGVYGRSTSKYGVYGKSDSSYAVLGISGSGYGVYGKSNDSIGVYATTVNGNIALRAVQPNSGAGNYAGYFDGNVQVNGNLTCSGSCVAAMGVATDKGERLVYADASTQSYLSDQGSATLKDGRAIVKIDPLFAQTVALGSGYQVFVTPTSDDTFGLAVVKQTATSFEVHDLKGGKGNFAFHWRISAPRQGYENVRMAQGPAKMPLPAAAVK